MIKLKLLFKKLLWIILGVYILFGFILYFYQNNFLYYPDNQNFYDCNGFNDYEKIMYNGTRFYFKENNNDNINIIYHGNAGSACQRSYYKFLFEQNNASIIFVEYTGYSNDSKSPSKNLIFKDVENIHEYIRKNKNYSKIMVYGESIGSGAASYHTSLGSVNCLILSAPFSKLEDVVKEKYPIYPISILLKEDYDNIQLLKNYTGEVLILHGDSDAVISNNFSKELFESLISEKKEYVLIEKKGHNDLWDSTLYVEKLSKEILCN